MHSARRHQHLFFPQLSLSQEKYLVNLVYSRPETWLGWHKSRLPDHPLMSLAHIVWLSLRGMGIVCLGFFTRRPAAERRASLAARSRERFPATAAALLLFGFLTVTNVRLPASTANPDTADAPQAQQSASRATVGPAPVSPATAQPAAFHDQYDLSTLAAQRVIALAGAGTSQNFFLDMPLTKIISSA